MRAIGARGTLRPSAKESAMSRNTVLIRTLSAAALFFALPAHLPAATPPSERVEISDLDLATPMGQQELEQRMRAAVRRVCAAAATPNTLAIQQQVWRCRSAALADAHRQLQDAGLPYQRQARR